MSGSLNRFLLRPAQPADAADLADLHVLAWRETYQGLVPPRVLAPPSMARRRRRCQTNLAQVTLVRADRPVEVVVVEEAGRGPVGFAACGPRRNGPAEFPGEFHSLYLVPSATGRGLGRRLMAAMAQSLDRRGLSPAFLRVMRGNRRARRFYERLGGVEYGEVSFLFEGALIVEIVYGWRDLGDLIRVAAASSTAGTEAQGGAGR